MTSQQYEYTDTQQERSLSNIFKYLKHNISIYLMIAPAVIFLLIVVVYPILKTFRLSLFSAPRSSTVQAFIGLQNYIQIFQNDFFPLLLWQTARWVILSVAIKTILGMVIAVHLNGEIKGRKFFRTAFLIPWGIPYAITAAIFRWIEQPQYGYLNGFLLQFGLINHPLGILGQPSSAWLGAIVADAWIGTPFMIVIFLAGLQSISPTLYEAAATDGASSFEQFRYITLPQMKGIIMIATLLSTIWTFVGFDVIWTMTRGGPLDSTSTLVIWIYQVGFDNGNLGLAAAYSTIGFVILSAFALVYLRIYTTGSDGL